MTTDARPFLLTDLPDEVREEVYDHVFSADDHEVGGVLVGAVGEDGRAEVHGMIPALEASSARASLTFTHDAWEQVLEVQERDFPDSPNIIGWYHSHPGFGIFLSEHDVFIHQNFFREPHQIAYVVDPQDETEGMFGWRNGRVELFEEGRTPRRRGRRRPGMVVELDDEDDAAAAVGATAVDLSQRSVPPTTPRHEITVDDEAPSRRRRGLLPLAAGLALVLGVGAALAIGGRHDDTQPVGGGAVPIEKPGDPNAIAKSNHRTRLLMAAAGSDAAGLKGQDQKSQNRHDHPPKQHTGQPTQTSTDSQTQTTTQSQGTTTQVPQTTTPQTTTQRPQTTTPQTTTQRPQTTTTQAPSTGFGDN